MKTPKIRQIVCETISITGSGTSINPVPKKGDVICAVVGSLQIVGEVVSVHVGDIPQWIGYFIGYWTAAIKPINTPAEAPITSPRKDRVHLRVTNSAAHRKTGAALSARGNKGSQ